jgi:steroid 5-alpha reductase family enzyme
MSPVVAIVLIAVGASALAWVASVFTRDYSWVDRLWSVLPVIYLWVCAIGSDFDARVVLMAILVTAWGTRLTFNLARRGGYSGMQDYRWAILRRRMSRWAFAVFNLVFIVVFQNMVLVLISLPAVTALEYSGSPLTMLDLVLAVGFVGALAAETIADQQQWRFHQWKRSQRADGLRPEPGFVQSGLWRYSRHPNFFFEQAQWWIVFLFAASAAGSVLQWTVIGPALLTVMFVGSTIFTESITRSRYPGYAARQKLVSPIIPWPPRSVVPVGALRKQGPDGAPQ